MFGAEVRTRFRPSYFPFTEPSGDVEIECFICGGKRLPGLFADRLAGDPGLRDGASHRAAKWRL